MGPSATQGFLPKDLDRADGLGGGLPRDLLLGFEMDAVLADLLGADQIRGLAAELAELTHASPAGLLGAGTDGQQLQIIGERF